MMASHTYSLEYSSFTRDLKVEKADLNLDQLAFYTDEFAQRVRVILVNFNEPDYFDLKSNFFDLQELLDQISLELIHYQPELKHTKINLGRDTPAKSFSKASEPYRTDPERIALLVSELGNYIDLYRKSAMEAGKKGSFLLKENLEINLKNLENMHWIFSMFSKY